ncbi:MAG: hypothetical protein GY951_04855 [Psychromonas sp.]|nr:hypothetical protein [Alteromonadales bacterium]MCP5077370.1 hypothetical protein [Psychromonas sp.]
MSVINKMHQELQESGDNSPILATMPEKKRKQKILLLCLICLLIASSVALSYLIYNKDNNIEAIAEITPPEVSMAQSVTEVQLVVVTTPTPAISVIPDIELEAVVIPSPVVKAAPSPTPVVIVAKVAIKKVTPKEIKTPKKEKSGHLEIKQSTLSNSQLANIYLKKSEKALRDGDTFLASQEKHQALNIKPDLHEVRKSLALYYYGVGEQSRATNLLKKGAVKFPEYSDFNLMLSRIALKDGDQQKAYLYLNQHPPIVEGHLDYHVSYAVLAQKFKNYEQAESLYIGLLSQRPNNGRWIMSLAIAQDKQGKEGLAVESYQKALLQVDLSSKAKKYINQRLTYLANQ